MDRKDWYYRQPVTQAEMDAESTYIENSERNKRVDDNIYGVIKGMVATLSGASSVDVTSGIAIDQLGKRIKAFHDGSANKIQSYDTDTAGASTSVTAGNERYIAIYARHGRNALDPRTDGNSLTVYHDQPECLHDNTSSAPANVAGLGGTGVDKFFIEMGASAATGTAVKPTLRTDAILLCDIKRTPSDASNVLDTARRTVFSIPDTVAVGMGNGLGVLMSDFTAWLGGRTNLKQTSLHAQIDKIFTDLAATTASDDGAERIGAAAGTNLSAGSVRSQIDELDTEKGGLALANTWAAINTFSTKLRVTPTTATPAIDHSAGAIAADARQLLFEFEFNRASQTNTKLRVYLNNKPMFTEGPQRSLLITQNARWDGTNWNADATGTAFKNAMAVEIGGYRSTSAENAATQSSGLVLYQSANGFGTPATDTGWNNRVDMGAQWNHPSNDFSTGSPWIWNNSPHPGGTNKWNMFTGEFLMGMSGGGRSYQYDLSLYGPASGAVRVPFSYNGASYSSAPSTVTVTNATATNCGAPSVTMSNSYWTLNTTVTALGMFVLTGVVNCRI